MATKKKPAARKPAAKKAGMKKTVAAKAAAKPKAAAKRVERALQGGVTLLAGETRGRTGAQAIAHQAKQLLDNGQTTEATTRLTAYMAANATQMIDTVRTLHTELAEQRVLA